MHEQQELYYCDPVKNKARRKTGCAIEPFGKRDFEPMGNCAFTFDADCALTDRDGKPIRVAPRDMYCTNRDEHRKRYKKMRAEQERLTAISTR